MAKSYFVKQAALEREHLESLVAELRSALEQHPKGASNLTSECVLAIHSAADAVAAAIRLVRERPTDPEPGEEAREFLARLLGP